ncbi:MAG: hypothetical protein H0V56_14100, partial [Chthoniobacterales bacterium]|nr:hypothetical protein [Chthoniobacterales bacterium]
AGQFSNTISGPGTITLAGQAVPEGGVGLLMFAVVAAGLLAARRYVSAPVVRA